MTVERNFKLTIAYDGRPFCGWQRQSNDITIQQLIEEAIEKICGQHHHLAASGRTDSGVHARAQVATVAIPTALGEKQLLKALNANLPVEIRIIAVEVVDEKFHAQYSAIDKTYEYLVHSSELKSPFSPWYATWLWYKPDLKLMQDGAKHLLGEHDFSSFMASGSSVNSTVRTLIALEITQDGETTSFSLTATGFLRQMVRNIVGTLLEIGRGKMEPEQMSEILAACDRNMAGPTAPATGLTLIKVNY
jgi:tRNA pseudouridine38-40 synthase